MDRHHQPPEPERAAGVGSIDGPVAGESAEAQQNRAFRSEAAALTRERARAVRSGLADIRSRARIMCDRAAAVGVDRTGPRRLAGEGRHLHSL